MSFVDLLNGKRRTPAAIFHKFRVDSSIHTRNHIFVEGYEDIGYYSKHLSCGDRGIPKYHICFGKKNLDDVLDLYEKSDCSDSLALFIRDSDFDVFLDRCPQGKNLFVTCGYAVENYVCSRQAVDSYMRTVFCLDEEEFNVEYLVQGYVNFSQLFHEWLAPLYGAAMFALTEGRNVDLNQLKTSEHFQKLLSGKTLPSVSDLPEIQSIGLAPTDFNARSEDLGRRYSALPALLWMRGKFLLSILTHYLRAKEQELRKLHKSGSISRFNRKAGANLNESGIFDRLSGLAHPTPRLASRLQLDIT